jgi:ABC-2 type transport system ATP-binding protein
MKKILRIENLSLSFKKHKILEDINFEIPNKSIVGLVGPNGAGKTSVIKCICRLNPIYNGNIYVFDKKNIANIFGNIGYVPEKENFPKKKVFAFLLFLSKLRNLPFEQFENNFKKYVKLFNCENLINKNLNALSSGEKKKILIIQALIHNPQLLIMDEPTENMDPDTRMIFYKIIKELYTNGTTILISSHQLDEIKKYITRLIIIKQGKIFYNKTINKKSDLFKIYRNTVNTK